MIKVNWKDEGYKVGNKALFVSVYFYGKPVTEDVEIIYVGTKILKVKKKDKTIEFRDRIAYSNVFGLVYQIYKSRQEYERQIAMKEERLLLIDEIKKSIDNLPLEKLNMIKSLIQTNMKTEC